MGKKTSTTAYTQKDEMEPIKGGEIGNGDNTYLGLRDILTVPEVAEFLRCDQSTLYNLIRSGQLSAVKVGIKSVRIKKTILISYLERGVA